jgi:D-glycero-D-manno-heptose 1,7-bisphosphate phosphatase
MSKLIVLDRDGVINHDSDNYIRTPQCWQPIAGSVNAIVRLKQAGYTLAIATNQSGIGRGLYTEDTLQSIHNKLHRYLANAGGYVDAVYYCPHTPVDSCGCRKPGSAMLVDAYQDLGAQFEQCYFIGDSATDMAAAIRVGFVPVLVLTGCGRDALIQGYDITKWWICYNLAHAVNVLLQGGVERHDLS